MSGLSERDVLKIVLSAPTRYKTYSIQKRNGGTRIISQPAREVKYLQRIIVDHFLINQPIHNAALAYRVGKSIRDNALVHAKNCAILKLDFKDFFPSIVATDWVNFCEKNAVFKDPQDIEFSSNLLFWKKKHSAILRLAIGAPSSPMLSNILMYDFDCMISEAVRKDHVEYSRYADDLTFSAKRVGNLKYIQKYLNNILREIKHPKLRINEDKTVYVTKKNRRFVTGLVLTDDGKVSLGRDRKRELIATVHHYIHGKLNMMEISRLSGLLAHANSVEPDFILRLERKYGDKIVNQIKGVPRQRDKKK